MVKTGAHNVKAMGTMALLPICDSSFECEDDNTYRAHPWSSFPLRRVHPGLGPHNAHTLAMLAIDSFIAALCLLCAGQSTFISIPLWTPQVYSPTS